MDDRAMEKLRKEENKRILKQMQDPEDPLLKTQISNTWYPKRKIFEKDPLALNILFSVIRPEERENEETY